MRKIDADKIECYAFLPLIMIQCGAYVIDNSDGREIIFKVEGVWLSETQLVFSCSGYENDEVNSEKIMRTYTFYNVDFDKKINIFFESIEQALNAGAKEKEIKMI